jgi:hypothetical protein
MSVFKVLINEVFVNIDINNLDIVDNKHVLNFAYKRFLAQQARQNNDLS